ncbi:MAG TPA: tetratricopeptide repeat protein [Armatimonadota bacterium]|nr:tetratricopeptide repeat protein [Armatimonadota bacterium]
MKQRMLLVTLLVAIAYVGMNLAWVSAKPRNFSRRVNMDPAYRAEQAAILQLANNGAAALYRKEYDRAESLLKECVARDPQAVEAWYSLGRTLEAQDRDREAQAAYQKVFHPAPGVGSTLEKDPLAVSQYALLCARLGQWEEAVRSYEVALENAKLPHGAPSPYVRLDPRVPQPEQLEVSLRLVRGGARASRGEQEEAGAEYQAAARLQPRSALVQYYLGDHLWANGRPHAAIAAFKKAAARGNREVRAAAMKALPPQQPKPK